MVADELGCADVTALECLRRHVETLMAYPQILNISILCLRWEVLPNSQRALRGELHNAASFRSTRDQHRTFVGLFCRLAGRPVTPGSIPAFGGAFGENAEAVASGTRLRITIRSIAGQLC